MLNLQGYLVGSVDFIQSVGREEFFVNTLDYFWVNLDLSIVIPENISIELMLLHLLYKFLSRESLIL